MAYYRREPSIFDNFTLSPLPYPVLFILLIIFLLLGASWFFTYEDFIETAEEQMNWALLIIPVVLVILIRWLSSIENFDGMLGFYPYDRRRSTYGYDRPQEGSSPWGVAAVVVLLLVLVSFQSSFQDMWKP
uniref:Transmembrane protein n=1 Tax=Ananas comosus var. bracteatus TaxID=296719 RepID=A0A6V7QW66_ANACO